MIKICRAVIKQDISLCLKFIVTVPEIEPHRFAFKGIDLVADISLWKFCTVQLKKSLPKFLRMTGKSRREHIRHTDLVCRPKRSRITKIRKRHPLVHEGSIFLDIAEKGVDIQHLRRICFAFSIQAVDPAIIQADPKRDSEVCDLEITVLFFQFRKSFL